jgi:CubicO group peptidase (beta-lactamase class C family)
MPDHDRNIVELLQRSVDAGTAPGLVAEWGTARGEKSRAVIGAASLTPNRIDISAETWFDLASLTKPLVTTTLVLLAVRSGVLAPSTRVGEVLREAQGSAVGDLEIDRLLSHCSGLPEWLPLYCLAEGDGRLLRSRLAGVALESSPGEKVIYSCVGFVVLGLMLEEIGGEPLDALFQREVVGPLGLESELGFNPVNETHSLCSGANRPVTEHRLIAELGYDQVWIPSLAHGKPDDGNARFLGGVAGNAGLFGTARGVGILASEYLPGGGALLSGADAEAGTSLRSGGLEQARAWGWQLASTPGCSAGEALSEGAFGHTGFTGVSVWCDPVTRGVFVLLANRNHPAQRENDLHPMRRRFHALAARSLEP